MTIFLKYANVFVIWNKQITQILWFFVHATNKPNEPQWFFECVGGRLRKISFYFANVWLQKWEDVNFNLGVNRGLHINMRIETHGAFNNIKAQFVLQLSSTINLWISESIGCYLCSLLYTPVSGRYIDQYSISDQYIKEGKPSAKNVTYHVDSHCPSFLLFLFSFFSCSSAVRHSLMQWTCIP